jgi:hypothetical protein
LIGDCPECVKHFQELSAQYGIGAPLSFAVIAHKYGTDPEPVFRAYMSAHHDLGHPDDKQTEALVSAMDEMVKRHDPLRPTTPQAKPEPHVYEPAKFGHTGAGFCAYGALLGSEAFCGRPHDDKVHSFLCPQCERRSREADDIRDGYCGHCHAQTGSQA